MLSISEAAIEYGKSRSTIQRLIDSGKLEAVEGYKPAKVTKESCEAYFLKPDTDREVAKLQKDLQTLTVFVMEGVKAKMLERDEIIAKQQSMIEDLQYRLAKVEMAQEVPTVSKVEPDTDLGEYYIDEGWE